MNYLTEQQSTDLITKLSNDDDFRAAFVADPASVLDEHYDVTLLAEDTPSGSIELPSKQKLSMNLMVTLRMPMSQWDVW